MSPAESVPVDGLGDFLRDSWRHKAFCSELNNGPKSELEQQSFYGSSYQNIVCIISHIWVNISINYHQRAKNEGIS